MTGLAADEQPVLGERALEQRGAVVDGPRQKRPVNSCAAAEPDSRSMAMVGMSGAPLKAKSSVSPVAVDEAARGTQA